MNIVVVGNPNLICFLWYVHFWKQIAHFMEIAKIWERKSTIPNGFSIVSALYMVCYLCTMFVLLLWCMCYIFWSDHLVGCVMRKQVPLYYSFKWKKRVEGVVLYLLHESIEPDVRNIHIELIGWLAIAYSNVFVGSWADFLAIYY